MREMLLVRGQRPVVLMLGIVVTLALSTGIACAEAPRLVPDGQFEAEGALGVAVDNSASESDPSRGDVYVAGFFTAITEPEFKLILGRVHKFDGSGRSLSPALFEEGPFGYSGVAVNPVSGTVYTLDAFTNEIDEYDPVSGTRLQSFPVPTSANLQAGFFSATVVQIAADSAGNVYVPVVSENKVLEYDPATCPAAPEPCVPLKIFTGGSGAGALKGPTGVAVDSSGNVWVADAGNQRIEELTPSDEAHAKILAEGVQSVALDGHRDVFAIVHNFTDFCGSLTPPCSHLVEYSPTGAQLADVGAGLFGAQPGGGEIPDLLAVDESTSRVYVTEGVVFNPPSGVHGRVFIYAPPAAPKLENELAAEVSTSEAKLGAVINPGGVSAAYRFEYGTTTSYGQSAPSPEGDTGGGFQSRTVWAAAKGLSPGTTYHYRVVVSSELGTVVGDDRVFTTETAARAACPNEQLRSGFSASLPDCRAYELVTPPNKTSAEPDPAEKDGDVESSFEGNYVAVDGNRLAFQEEDVLPDSPSAGKSYVATRGTSGWSAENVFPPTNYYNFECPSRLNTNTYSADLSEALLVTQGVGIEPVGRPCGLAKELVSGEPADVENLFLRDNTNGSYRLVDVAPPGVTPSGPTFVGASRDLHHIAFEDEARLTADATAGAKNLYEWSDGSLRLPIKLANGAPVAGSFKEFSPDGSHAFFTYEGKLYARSNGTETVQLDASQVGGPGGGANLVSASADGSQALISDDASADLTADTEQGSGVNLYKYDFASGQLTDLTPAGDVELEGVFGVSEDDSYVYFEAFGSLAPGATQGQPNRYLWQAGATSFLSALTGVALEHLRVSKNGLFVSFASGQKLTSYDNTDTVTGNPDYEFYIYSAVSNGLVCASCNPSGAPPAGGPRVEKHAAHNLSESGQFFFETTESLLPADTNGRQDVYEFEPDGVSSCGEPAGCIFLISTGTGARDTWLIEASPSGNDVFLRENQKLVPRDTVEEMHTIYDARVDGGFAEPSPPSACATPEACRTASPPQPPIFGAPASQTFSGQGNLAPAVQSKRKPPPVKCRKGFVKKRDRCVKRKIGKRAHRKSIHAGHRKGR